MRLILVSLMVLAACSRGQDVPSPKSLITTSPTPSPKPVQERSVAPISAIRIRRSPCYGSCPVYELEISAKGQVKFVGDRFVEQTGFHTSQIDPNVFGEIDSKVRAIGFFELKKAYRYEPDGCTSWATDNPTVTIIVAAGDLEKSVSYYYGCRGLPIGPELVALADLVDNLGGSKQWIGHD